MTHPLTDALPSYMDALALRQACGEIEAGLRAVLENLIERADTADDMRYGTLSAGFVREVCQAALEATK
jgi:hypothetical protein